MRDVANDPWHSLQYKAHEFEVSADRKRTEVRKLQDDIEILDEYVKRLRARIEEIHPSDSKEASNQGSDNDDDNNLLSF